MIKVVNEMQYKGYNYNITRSSVVVRDSKGKFIQEFSTEDEALDYIDGIDNDRNKDVNKKFIKKYVIYSINNDYKIYIHETPGMGYAFNTLNAKKYYDKEKAIKIAEYMNKRNGMGWRVLELKRGM